MIEAAPNQSQAPQARPCAACHRDNLPGGVRCVYCGTHFPSGLGFDFDMAGGSPPAADAGATGVAASSGRGRAGLIGSLAILALKAKSLLVYLKFAKLLTTFGSMFVFIWAESLIFGWSFAAGFAVSIFVHEMGHVVVNWRKGLKQTAPMFIPFVGALIMLRGFPDDPTIQSESGAGGPVAGALAAVVCLGIGMATGSPYWFALAGLGFLINLFNLIPFPPLDGSHICTVFSPRLWDCVLIVQLLWAIKAPSSGYLWAILLVGFLFRLGRGSDTRYLLARPAVRLRMAAIYLTLSIALSYGAGAAMTLAGNAARHRPGAAAGLPARYVPIAGAAASTHSITGADQAAGTGEADARVDQVLDEIAGGARAAGVVVAGALWIGTALLLGAATRQGAGRTGAALIGGAVAASAALGAALPFLPADQRWPAVFAWAAASVAALVFSGYQAHHRRTGLAAAMGLFLLAARCLAWAAGAALLVAYAANSVPIVLAVLVTAAAFLLRYRWLFPAGRAAVLSQLGGSASAIEGWRAALAMRPDAASAAWLWIAVANAEIQLWRGGAALAAVDEHDRLAAQVGRGPAVALRASALILLDRFDEALACCEQLLQFGGANVASRLLAVHDRLAKLALLRGWPDEAVAQANVALHKTPRGATRVTGGLHALKALALAELGDGAASEEACTAALKASRDPMLESAVALAHAQTYLCRGDAAGADRETERALRLAPGSLAVRFYRARALAAGADALAGRRLLDELATDCPAEHWGRMAAAALAAP